MLNASFKLIATKDGRNKKSGRMESGTIGTASAVERSIEWLNGCFDPSARGNRNTLQALALGSRFSVWHFI